jgi:hypothetical protein
MVGRVAASAILCVSSHRRRVYVPVKIRGIEVTTADVHYAAEPDDALPDAPGDTCADTAYPGSRPEGVIRARSGRPRVVHTGAWGGPDAA